MNKKGKLYSSNKSNPYAKIKVFHQKSNQKQIISHSMERRKKKVQLPEETTEKYPRINAILNKSTKLSRLQNNQYVNERREKNSKGKEYTNEISSIQKDEEIINSQRKPKRNIYLNNDNEGQDIEKIDDSKYKDRNKTTVEKSKEKEEDYSEEEREAKDNDDLIYRTLYKSSKKNKDRIKEKEEKYKKNKEKEKENLLKNQISKNINDKNLRNSANTHNNFNIEIEQGDNLHYNNEDKKIYLNVYNNKSRSHKKSIKRKNRPSQEAKAKYNNENENLYSPKTNPKIKPINIYDYNPERVIDLFVIDEDYDINFLTKTKKKINRKNNQFREIIIENYEPNMPMKKEKFTGFIFIRKSKGKKIYKLELPDDIEQINEIFKNEPVMMKNQIIQIVPMDKMQSLNNPIQNEVKISYEDKNYEKELEKEKEIIKDKERQITLLKNKNEELNNTIKKQLKQINQNEKDIKNIKFNLDQLKDSFQTLDKENKSLKSQLQTYKFKRKSSQHNEEEANQRTLQEMKDIKDRIQKYKQDLRKSSMVSASEDKDYKRKSTLSQHSNASQEKGKEKNNIKEMVQALENKRKEERESIKENEKENPEEEYVDDYNYDMYDEKDPKARKMKQAMARFRKKYKDIIIENKKNLKMKEEEEKEKEEKEEKENEIEEENNLIKQKEEQERIEKERKEKEEQEKREKEKKEKEEKEKKERERKEKERKEKEEKEKKERKEKEKKEKEERERKDRERKERERKEKERKEKEEKERKEREKKEKERKEKEEKERKERERKEKEKKEKEEREKKEKERKEKEEKEKKEKEKKEKEKKEKEEKEKKEKEKNKLGPFGGGKNKMPNNFAKMLADKMKFGPPGGVRKSSRGSDHSIKQQIITEKKPDVVNLIQSQEFKRTNKKKPTRKMFIE